MKSSKSLKENMPPSTGKSKIPRKVATRCKEEKPEVPPSTAKTKNKYAGIVPSDSPKRILGELPCEQKKIVKVRKLQQEIMAQEVGMKGVKEEKDEQGETTQSGPGADEFEKDESALQSILDETGIEGISSQKVVPQRHTLAAASASKDPRQSMFSNMRRETGIKNFQRICDEYIRRASMMPPQAKRPCVEKMDIHKTPKTPAPSPFHSSVRSTFHVSPYTPRPSVGPSRIRVEKSLFGLDGKSSPIMATCQTPVRTPIKKEVLSFTAQRVPRAEARVTPQPIRLAVTSVKKKKTLTWADEQESPEISQGYIKGKKSLFGGQGDNSENDNQCVSRRPCDAITSSCVSVTAKANEDDESHSGTSSEESRVTRQVEGKQHEMQRDQNQESTTIPFISSHDTSHLTVDIRTLASATEKFVQIQDNAQSRPNSGNLGGLSHNLSTAVSVDDSQEPTQTMTQLSKFPGQGQETLSKYSQQGHGSAKTNATSSLENVQQIPSHESQMFIKYVKQARSAQSSSGYSHDISQSQTKSNINVDNSEAMQTLYDNSVSDKQRLTSDILDSGQNMLEQTEVDDNGNIKTVTTFMESPFSQNKNDVSRQAATDVKISSSFATTFSQGSTQAAVYAEDTQNKNENFESSEIQLTANRNLNKNVAKCETNVKRKIIAPPLYETSECKDTSISLGAPLWTPKREPICDQIFNPNLRVESNRNQVEATVREMSNTRFTLQHETKMGLTENVNRDTYQLDQTSVSDTLQTLFAPLPVRQQTLSLNEPVTSTGILDPPIMTPLAAKDIARKHGFITFSPFRKTEFVSEKQNLWMKEKSACNVEEEFEHEGQEHLNEVSHITSPEIDIHGAMDLSKSATKKKQDKQKFTNSRNSNGISDTHTRPAPYFPRSRIIGSAFQPVRPSRLSPAMGSLSLYGNCEAVGSPLHDCNSKNTFGQQVVNGRFMEALLDEEVAHYFRQGLLETMSRRCGNPVARTLLEGDDMHFIPICEEIRMMESDSQHDGQFEDSAFTRCNRST